jgi:hypothetical protein
MTPASPSARRSDREPAPGEQLGRGCRCGRGGKGRRGGGAIPHHGAAAGLLGGGTSVRRTQVAGLCPVRAAPVGDGGRAERPREGGAARHGRVRASERERQRDREDRLRHNFAR